MNTPTRGNAPFSATTQGSNAPASGTGEAMATVTVARGRSIKHDGKTYTAGQPVSLPASDLPRLRELGFIARGNDAAHADDDEQVRTQGPTFETTGGPSVKQKR